MALRFLKMHGLGNDFVVLDARAAPLALDAARARAIADRKTGVGCDQLILIEPPRDPKADAVMRIYNADGGEVAACGNATRCIARLLMDQQGRDRVVVETDAGLLDAAAAQGGLILVDMGPARLGWRDIPLAEACDTLSVPVEAGPLARPTCVSMGNPHAVFFVADAAAIPLAELGPVLEHHPMFPERANIGVAEVRTKQRLRLRVWERGAGITLACGTGACAAVVAANLRGLTGRRATVEVDGGELVIEWLRNGHVTMTGPVATSFAGELSAELARGLNGGGA
ncbi:MAG TPA: diaminopimelate epimerase [Candidatus Sulfotelmatobacter sp.]|nr:diaminopimelate epimerase [Candidatus Sulfotelmatobacter sp.]